MAGRVEKTVFISYRRTNLPWALFIYQNLTMHGYDVFFDYQSIDSGSFEKVILDNIRARAHFVLILTPSALERCKNPGDWLKREIETAIDEKRNIVPLMMEGFDFGNQFIKEALTGKLSLISGINALSVPNDYALEAMERLRERFLNKTIDDVSLPSLQPDAESATEAQKLAANKAEPVQEEELTAQTWFERGYVFHENDNLDEAYRCYSEAIRLDPEFDAAYSNSGGLLREFRQYEEAEVACRKAIELNPENYYAYGNLGNVLSDLQRYDEAEVAYHKVIELNPSDDQAYSNLGNLLSDLKRYDEAEQAYRKAIEINSSNYINYFNLGNLLHDLKHYGASERAYYKAIELNPYDDQAYTNLGNLLNDLKRYDEAEAACRKAIDLNPSNSSAYNNLGNSLRNLERNDEAEKTYHKALELDPTNDFIYTNLGILLRVLKRNDEAETAYLKAIELNPENFDGYLARASITKQLGKEIAKENIEKASQFIPEDDWYNRACFESICDNFDLAFEYLEKASKEENFDAAWAWKDPDFQWIRDDPRFTKIVGAKPE
ncbi:MAG TPA: hypothetical protein DEP19_05955 [Anaerolineae bacterium]|nr:hypothetical protein [Anaerolineae bacterium]HCK67367.1 hypothetical protein [Anaerolineae bacterium]